MSKKKILSFQEAVKASPDVSENYCAGLTAFGKYSSKVSVDNTHYLQGSIDIDKSTEKKYPNDSRWDYAFAYKGEVYFIEVHSAYSSEVSVLMKKFQWLNDWLIREAPEILKLKSKSRFPFYWIQSKGFAIPKTSPQYRQAISIGLKPIAKLNLSE